MAVITAADFAKAKSGTNLPGSFNVTHPAVAAPAPTPKAPSAPAPRATTSGTAGSGGSTYVDPAIAAAAQKAAQAQADYNSLKGTAFGSITDAINNAAGTYQGGILDYLDSEKQQQNTINNKSVQNELSREQGHQGVLDMIGNGLQSSGQILASHNAGSSSAGEAFARAYGTLGRQQESKVGNQFEQGQSGIANDQNNLTIANASELRHLTENKSQVINSIVSQAVQQLGSLNQAAAYASLPDRINIDQQKTAIQNQAMTALQQFDNVLSQGLSGNTALSPDQVRAQASGLLTAGVAPDNQFDYTTSAPPQVGTTGPSSSSLPVFATPKKTDQTA